MQRLGHELVISNVDTDTSQQAISIKNCFDAERDFVLRSLPWPWATAYAALGLVAGTTSTAANNDWQYSYRYPPDCLQARRLTVLGNRTTATRIPFAIGRDSTARLIFTDEPDAELEYTIAITAATEFDPIFASMLAWRIAATIAPAQSRTQLKAADAMRMFLGEWQVAASVALNERQADPPREADWIQDRA